MARRCALVLAGVVLLMVEPAAHQAQYGAAVRELVLDFLITQGTDCSGPASGDQITILFSNQDVSLSVPAAALGDDIIAEFSFMAPDVQGELKFRRRVRDRAFLGARFIRVVNTGGDGWCGGTLTLLVDGSPQLNKIPLAPRKGNPANGLQNWNRDNWGNKSYWEAPLPSLLRPAERK